MNLIQKFNLILLEYKEIEKKIDKRILPNYIGIGIAPLLSFSDFPLEEKIK